MHNLFPLLSFVHESLEKRFQFNSCLLDMIFFRKTHRILCTMSKGMIKYGNVLFFSVIVYLFFLLVPSYKLEDIYKVYFFHLWVKSCNKKLCLGVELILQTNKLNLSFIFVFYFNDYLHYHRVLCFKQKFLDFALSCLFRVMNSIKVLKNQTNYPVRR